MTSRAPARRATRRVRLRRVRAAGLLLAVAAIAAVASDGLSSTSSPVRPRTVPPIAVRGEHRAERPAAPLGEADGAVPDGTSVFDDGVPGVAKLDPALSDALRRAAADAPVTMLVDSGWRSTAYQEHLLQEAIAKYGSKAEAARWVATPATSAHVSGDAVDIGPSFAAAWLGDHGAAYGLCRVYGNEPWHFELRPGAAAGGCPPAYADPTHDPRMR